MGKYRTAMDHASACMNLYQSDRHPTYRTLYSDDPGVVTLAHLARTLLRLGYPEQAEQQMQAAIDLAHSIEHPVSLIFALSFACDIRRLQDNLDELCRLIEQIVTLCNEHHVPQWLNLALVYRGWVEAMQEDALQGLLRSKRG